MLKIFYGSNTFAKRLELAKIKTDFKSKYGEYSVRELSAEELNSTQFMGEIMSSGLFSAKELIIVKRAEDNLDALRSLLEANLSSDLKEVILSISSLDKRTSDYKEVQKHAGFAEFYDLPEAQLKSWVTSTAKKLGFSLASDALQDLILRTNLDQQEVWICLNQLALLQKEKIETADLDIFLAASSSETAFNLLESALQKNPARFQKSLKELELFREDPYQIVALLCSQAHSLVAVALGSEAGRTPQNIAGDIGIHPFVASNQAKLVRSLSLNKAKSLVVAETIGWLDLSLKTVNKTEPWPTIDAALMQISVL